MVPSMAQLLNSQEVTPDQKILCLYINRTRYIQTLKLLSTSQCQLERLERLIFPGEQYLFDADQADEIDVHTNYYPQGISVMRISCLNLRVKSKKVHQV